MQQRDVHDRVAPAERRIAHEYAKACFAQALNARGDTGITGDHVIRDFGQAQAFADNAALDVALEDFGQRLAACLHQRIAGGHAVAHVEIADDVDRDPGLRCVAQARVGQCADAAIDIAGVQVDQDLAVDSAFRVVKRMQLRVEHFSRPGAVISRRKPAFLGVVHERHVGAPFAQVEVRPEIVGIQAFEEFAQRAGARGKFGGAFAVGKQHRAFMIAHMHGPD